LERYAQLAPSRGAGIRLPLKAGLFLALLLTATAWAQCPNDPDLTTRIQKLFDLQNWAEVAQLAAPAVCRSPDLNFEYGLALAHLGHWPEAHAALLAGRGQSRSRAQQRFDVELAGIAFEQKRYPGTAAWLRRALQLDPKDDYANNFAGTVYFLMGNVSAALKNWNRVGKPSIAGLQFEPQLHVQRLLLDRAFAFSPAAVLHQSDYSSTDARLRTLGIFPVYNIALSARTDGKFDAEFHALERNGFGSSRAQALVSILGGIPYETIYPSYFNIGRTAANFEALLRWDSQKRRAWLALSAPVHDLPQWRWTLATDDRDENWTIRRSFTGSAPPLGSLNLRRETLAGSLTGIPSGRFQWTVGAELSHRGYRNVVDGSALTPALTISGYELKQFSSIQYQLLDLPERRFSLSSSAKSETARLWASPSSFFEKLQGSASAHWFPDAADDRYEVEEQLRAGRTGGAAPFDEMFMLGVERDNDLWLRGHIGTRDRQKGSSPLGYNYLLSNAGFDRRLYANGLFTLQAGPLLDIARMGAPNTALSSPQWLFDGGVEAKLTILGTKVVFTYGRDLRAGTNAFYGTVVQ
jgi:tetratricopeptide (TPR) repeat protein